MLQQDKAPNQLHGRDRSSPNTAPHDPRNQNVHPADLPSLSSPKASNSPLACPFYKFNPVLCDGCANFHFFEISDVKQHLVRFHSLAELPVFSCTECHSLFVDEPSRMLHLNDGSCRIVAAPEKLSPQEVMKLEETKFTPETSAASQWFAIWDLLFPGHSKPQTPYIESNPIKEAISPIMPTMEKQLRAAYPMLHFQPQQIKEIMDNACYDYFNNLPVSRQGPSVDHSSQDM